MGSQWLEDGQRGPPPRLPNTTVSGSPSSHSALEAGRSLLSLASDMGPWHPLQGDQLDPPQARGQGLTPTAPQSGMMRMRPEAVAGR